MTDFENQEAPAEYLAHEQAQEQNYEAPQQEVPKESDQEMNFRQLREKADRLEKERDQDRQMMMALQAIQGQTTPRTGGMSGVLRSGF